MDPVTAIAGAVDSIFGFYGQVLDAFTWKDKARWESLPEYRDPLDYKPDPDYTIPIILGAMVLVFIVMAIALTKK
jgi:hypothetical protein